MSAWTKLRKRAGRCLRTAFELAGSDRMSCPALHGLDRKLQKWLPHRDGFYVEAGANNGFKQSNTYFFEKRRGWRGVLVEPVPWLAEECQLNRPRSRVYAAALVPSGYAGATIQLDFSDLTSSVSGAFADEAFRRDHQRHGLEIQAIGPHHSLEVPARTLQSILDEAQAPHDFDLLSLDVEGFEPAVLDGLDLSVYRPRHVLVEVWDRAKIHVRLDPFYRAEAILSATGRYEDVLFVRRSVI